MPQAPSDVTVAYFNSTTGKLPYPIDLYFAPSTTVPTSDGTLNLPTLPYRNAAMQAALNSQDGWSANSSIDAGFSSPIDGTTIGANSIKIVKLWLNPATKGPANPANAAELAFLPSGATSPVAGVLTYGTDFTADVSPDVDSEGRFLRITPLKPLAFSKGPAVNSGADAGKVLNVGYLVILTDTLHAADGKTIASDDQYAAYKAAPADCSTFTGTPKLLCQLTKAQLSIASGIGLDPARVILSWSFSVQSMDDPLAYIAATSAAKQTLVVPTGLTTKQANASLAGKADIYVGSTKLNYYLDAPSATNPAGIVLTSFWKAAGPPNPAFGLDAASRNLTMFNPVPAVTTEVTVPLLVTVPNATSACPGKPAAGWPVVIVQHGITRNRSDALAIADSYADACTVVAAIDAPLHGITDTTSPLYCTPTLPQCVGATERTFNVDLVNNTTGVAPGDGKIDPSGQHIINLTSPQTARDNLRQEEADLIQMTKSVPTIAIAPAGTPLGIDPARVHFTGQSMGAIAGGAFAHFASNLRTVTLESPGGKITQLLLDSPTFGPRIIGGVTATAVKDSYAYNLFFRDFQAVIDPADPINHIKDAAAKFPLHMMEITGDQVVPNSATDRLIAAAGLHKLKTIGPNPVSAGNGAYTLLTAGAHGSMFSPTPSPAATVELQTEAVSFVATTPQPGGPFVLLSNPAVLNLN